MRVSAVWLATGLAGLALVLGTTPAVAAQQQPALSLSRDGQRWAAWLDRPLFEPSRRWVPGDTQTATVWVRNLSSSPADLDLRVLGGGGGSAGAFRDLELSVAVGGMPVVLDSGHVSRLAALTGPTRVDLTLTLPARATDRAQQRVTAVSLRVGLTHVGAGTGRTPSGSEVPLSGLSEPVGGHLPGRGAPPFGLPLAVVAVVVAVGAAFGGSVRHRSRGTRA